MSVLAALVIGGLAEAVFQNGLDGYEGCTVAPDAERIALKADEDTTELRIRFELPAERFRATYPRVVRARVELFYLYEWWTAYKHELRCEDAFPGGELGASVTIFGDRTGKRKTRNKRFLSWELPPELVRRWLREPASNKGLKVHFAGSELLDAKKGGGKEVGFMGNATRLARYRPRLVVEYGDDLRPEEPRWKTDLAGRKVGGRFVLRWDASDDAAGFDVDVRAGTRWRRIASNLAPGTREYEWDARRWKWLKSSRLRIRARKGRKLSRWNDSAEFALTAEGEPFRLGALPTVLKLRRDVPPAWTPETVARIELARNEEEGVQLVIDRSDRGLRRVTVEAGDLVSETGARIPAKEVRIWPVGYVFTKPSGNYLTGRDGWFADVLLQKREFDVEPETVQPVWVSFRARNDAPPGAYKGRLRVTAEGLPERSIPFEIAVWDFELPVRQGLPFTMFGGTNVKAYGLDAKSPEAADLRRRHEGLLLECRMTPAWLTKKFGWTKPTLPRKPDGSFDFADYDRTVERLVSRGVSRFLIAGAPRLGKWGFPDRYSEEWKRTLRGYLKEMARHLDEKGWLELAMFYNIDEASRKEWPSCRMLYRLVKDIEPRLRVFQTLNEPRVVKELADHCDVVNVNMRQYYKARISELQKKGKEVWWYVCCWPSENPNLFTDYPAIDGRVIGWMTYKFGLKGFGYWQSMAWGKAFVDMGEKRYIDEILSKWQTHSFGTYNGDGCLLYPGPGNAILRSVRLENLRDGLEDYEYLALLRGALEAGRLRGDEAARARELLKVDDRICDMQFGYGLEGQEMLRARRDIAQLLSRPSGRN